MAVHLFAQVLVASLFVGSVVVALTFWNQILNWASQTLFPWIKKNLPELESYVRNAFAALDKVVTPIRNKMNASEKLTKIKEAWKKLRTFLLKILVEFKRKTQDEWVKRITYWTIRILESNKPEVVQVVTEEIVDVDSLPDDVRKEWFKQNKTTQDIDVTQLRDHELELAMIN